MVSYCDLNRVADGTKKLKLLQDLNIPSDDNTSQVCIMTLCILFLQCSYMGARPAEPNPVQRSNWCHVIGSVILHIYTTNRTMYREALRPLTLR